MDTARWSAALWPFVRSCLPPAPATVLEIGCGTAGGFVPMLREAGYEAVGVDPEAPAAAKYERMPFERYEPPHPVDAIVASRSLHHVDDVDGVVTHAVAALRPGGAIVVAEWSWERFDEGTAQWCFARLATPGGGEPSWLQRRRAGWLESGLDWDGYFAGWAAQHGLHRGERILQALDHGFERVSCRLGPYFFADLPGTAEDDEQAAIEAGELRANGLRYAGCVR
jgi:SAM-dependent methyltransferase